MNDFQRLLETARRLKQISNNIDRHGGHACEIEDVSDLMMQWLERQEYSFERETIYGRLWIKIYKEVI